MPNDTHDETQSTNGNGGPPLPNGTIPAFLELCRRYGPLSALVVAMIVFNGYFMLTLYESQHETDVYIHETMMNALKDSTVAITGSSVAILQSTESRQELIQEIHESTEMRRHTLETMAGVKQVLEQCIRSNEAKSKP